LVFGCALGSCVALVRGTAARPLRWILEGVGSLAFVLPGIALALLVVEMNHLFPLVPDRGLGGVVLAHVLANVLIVASAVEQRLRAWLSGQGGELLEAAATLGASKRELWKQIVLPVWKEEAKAWAPLIFLWSFSAFSTVVLLGAGPSDANPEILLFHSLQNEFQTGRVLVLMALQALSGYFLLRTAFRFRSPELATGKSSMVNPKLLLAPQVALGLSWLLLLPAAFPLVWLLVAPVLTAATGKLWPEGLGVALLNSLLLAALTMIFVVALSYLSLLLPALHRRQLTVLGGISSTFLAACWMGAGVDLWFESAFGQIFLAALAVAFVQLPVALFWIERRLQSLPAEWTEAATSLGGGPWDRARLLLWPQLKDVFARIATIAIVGGIGELSVTSLFVNRANLLALEGRRRAVHYDFEASRSLLLTMALVALLVLLLQRWLFRRRAYGRITSF